MLCSLGGPKLFHAKNAFTQQKSIEAAKCRVCQSSVRQEQLLELSAGAAWPLGQQLRPPPTWGRCARVADTAPRCDEPEPLRRPQEPLPRPPPTLWAGSLRVQEAGGVWPAALVEGAFRAPMAVVGRLQNLVRVGLGYTLSHR